jgi:arsenate reductase (thioredoxin)
MASTNELTVGQRQVLLTIRAHRGREFDGVFGPETIERFLTESVDQLLPQAPITSFVPALAERMPATVSAPSPRSKD